MIPASRSTATRLSLRTEAVAQFRPTMPRPGGEALEGVLTVCEGSPRQISRRETGLRAMLPIYATASRAAGGRPGGMRIAAAIYRPASPGSRHGKQTAVASLMPGNSIAELRPSCGRRRAPPALRDLGRAVGPPRHARGDLRVPFSASKFIASWVSWSSACSSARLVDRWAGDASLWLVGSVASAWSAAHKRCDRFARRMAGHSSELGAHRLQIGLHVFVLRLL